MPTKDPLGRSKQIGALRKRMAKQLDLHNNFTDISPALGEKLSQAAEYNDYRRIENERQLESIKSMLAGFMFDENVVVKGSVSDKNGGMREVELNRFEVMLKASNMFLSAMNMQNKMWGLYTVPETSYSTAPNALNIRNVTVDMVQELQRIAKKEHLALPDAVKSIEPRPTDNSTQTPDLRRGVTG
jgi:hypothetical protein